MFFTHDTCAINDQLIAIETLIEQPIFTSLKTLEALAQKDSAFKEKFKLEKAYLLRQMAAQARLRSLPGHSAITTTLKSVHKEMLDGDQLAEALSGLKTYDSEEGTTPWQQSDEAITLQQESTHSM
ncbi:MAG: hypothetical protein COV52_07305 [Gammaproteobacteria bacterium CG11_big_fil_rev_8_21_14_0_20_46_22]|nr:MAG: hypothetical protein COW05_00320 [Gammaproteobacteria bacterium CG12_big_fil_rev_8_21_14_0_65_46_12]PIR10841.1 MAG: hypothetical protein COV52_07305 [Gammaproteobacteria bacterium CG11_big_fil_rev_8_21_14_0_20_46_22]